MNSKLAVLIMLAVVALPAMPQTAAAHDGQPALKFAHPGRKRSLAYFVEYVQYGNEPAFRIRAHHYHAWCNGYLYFTPNSVAYDPSFTPNQKDAVNVRRADLQGFVIRPTGVGFSLPGKPYEFAFLSDPEGESSPQDQSAELVKFLTMASTDFASAQQQFVANVAGFKALASLPAKPFIKVLVPVGAAPDSTVDGHAASQPVMGIVSAAGGISGVVVNGRPANTKLLAKEVALFDTDRFPLASGNTEFTVAASSPDGNQNQIAFRVVRPEVRILSPAPGTKVRDEKVTVQGALVGMRDLQRLEVAGKTAALSKHPDGSYDFRVPDVPLSLGPNVLSGFYEQSDGQRSTFDIAVVRAKPVPPLHLADIEDALRNSLSPARIAALVDDRGVDFELTPEVEKRLRARGATPDLLEAIENGRPAGPR